MSRAARKHKHKRNASPGKDSTAAPFTVASDSAPASAPSGSDVSAPELRGPSRPLLWPLVVVFAIQGAYLGTVFALVLWNHAPATLNAMDAIALPEGRARDGGADIGVRLHRASLPLVGRRVGGVEIEFFAALPGEAARSVGSAITTPDGVATRVVKVPQKPGSYRFLARLAQPDSLPLSGKEEAVLLEVIPADRPLLLVLAPEAVSRDGETRTGAPAALEQLAALRALVYVATDKQDPPRRLRAWLELNAFPPGPVLSPPLTSEADPGAPPDLPDFLRRLGLSSRWEGDPWGVTCTLRHADALASAGFRVVLLGLEARGLMPDGRTIFALPTWDAARKKLESHR